MRLPLQLRVDLLGLPIVCRGALERDGRAGEHQLKLEAALHQRVHRRVAQHVLKKVHLPLHRPHVPEGAQVMAVRLLEAGELGPQPL